MFVSASAVLLTALLPAALAFSPSFPYGTEKVRGVSIGGWLVLEPWITPSLFDDTGNPDIVDEWSFGELQDRTAAERALEAHWDYWITEADFAAIAAAGYGQGFTKLNHVRLPIGYWAWEVGPGEPYIQGQLPYLRRAVTWANYHGLKLIIDLHGVPGSQNGFDNSGRRMARPGWQSNQTDIGRTNRIFRLIASEFGPQHHTVAAIQPMNEPAGFYGQDVLDAVRQYWLDSYTSLRASSENTLQLIHDAFQQLGYWNGWERPPNYQGVALDTHIYQMFSDAGVAQTQSQHIATACEQGGNLENFVRNQLWAIVGEWTPCMTDCAKYLNGRGVGARYDGTHEGSPRRVGSCAEQTGSGESFNADYKTYLRQMWEAQVVTFEKASGWIMWTWKTEQADEWSYEAGLRYGWIPRDPTSLQYPHICG